MAESLTKSTQNSTWARYRHKHKWERVADFPRGVQPPRKVRIYSQNGYFRLQWWDPRRKKKMSARVDGDLISAISRAREIDEQLLHFRTASGCQKFSHQHLVEQFVADLANRAESGQISGKTVARYSSALQHYLQYSQQPHVSSRFPSATQVDRVFAMEFQAHLSHLMISPNGHTNTRRRRMVSSDFVLDIVRAMFEWAADPDRGDLVPSGFRNPFLRQKSRAKSASLDLFGDPDITMAMAADFLNACDHYQLPLFALLLFCGLRASEPCLIFRDHLGDDGWLKVVNLPQLGYLTKGRRDKRFPLPDRLFELLANNTSVQGPGQGVLFTRRTVFEGTERAPRLTDSLSQLVAEYDTRCQRSRSKSAEKREQLRDQILREAGGCQYDRIENEFHAVARKLNWPATATLKDFRHLFSTEMMNGGIPDYYRRYLLGHAVSSSALTNYTHLNELQKWYSQALTQQFGPALQALESRADELRLVSRRSA